MNTRDDVVVCADAFWAQSSVFWGLHAKNGVAPLRSVGKAAKLAEGEAVLDVGVRHADQTE